MPSPSVSRRVVTVMVLLTMPGWLLARFLMTTRYVCELAAFVAVKVKKLFVPITTFAPEPFEVLRPMSAVIQPLGDEHLATFFDANINASGETQEEAFANLKDVLLGTFQMLERMSESQLGPGPRHQRAVFEGLFRPHAQR